MKKYSIGYTKGLYDIITSMKIEDYINDVYFSMPNKFNKSARFADLTEIDELMNIKSLGIKLHIVMNGPIWDTNYSDEDVIEILKFIESYDILTTNNVVLLKHPLFRPNITVKNSVNNKVKTIDDVKTFHKMLGITSIMLDRSLNRNKDELDIIIQYCKENNIETTILLNEGCIPNCHYKQMCDYEVSEGRVNTTFDRLTCGGDFYKEPSLILKSPFILPSALKYYDVNYFKIACRNKNEIEVRKRLQAYIYDNRTISIKHLVDTEPSDILKIVNTHTLEEYNFTEHVINCKNKCHECNFCDIIFNSILKGK